MEKTHILIAGEGFTDGIPRDAVCFATAAGSGEKNWRHGFLVPIFCDSEKAMAYLKAIQSQFPFEMTVCSVTEYCHYYKHEIIKEPTEVPCVHIKFPVHNFKILVIMGNLVKGPSEFPTLIDRMVKFDPNTLLNDLADEWRPGDCPLSEGHFPFALLLNQDHHQRPRRHNNFPSVAKLAERMRPLLPIRKYWRTVLEPELATSTQPFYW